MPNYNNLRSNTKFTWDVSGSYAPLIEITKISTREFYLNPDAGIQVFKKGLKAFQEIYPEDVLAPSLTTPPVSYGHVNCLGAELQFPEAGEVCAEFLCEKLKDGVDVVSRDIDFAKSGMMPFYIDYREKMRTAFPGESVRLSFRPEGPLTTAYLLRGENFFLDPYDNPDLSKKFLKLVTESIIKYNYFMMSLDGLPKEKLSNFNVADDVPAMLAPDLWAEFVMPYFEMFFQGMTDGIRYIHVDDLKPEHLKFLEQLNVSFFDPSVSFKLNPEIIAANSPVPFSWTLCDFHFPALTATEVADFVFKAAADGASSVSSRIGYDMLSPATVNKVYSFVEAAKETKKMLADNAQKEDLLKCVSDSGEKKFWNSWQC